MNFKHWSPFNNVLRYHIQHFIGGPTHTSQAGRREEDIFHQASFRPNLQSLYRNLTRDGQAEPELAGCLIMRSRPIGGSTFFPLPEIKRATKMTFCKALTLYACMLSGFSKNVKF